MTSGAGGRPEPGHAGAAEEGEEDGTAGFRRTRDGVSVRFTAAQAVIVRNLVSQVAELVSGDAVEQPGAPPGPRPATSDPGELAGVEPFELGGPVTAPDDPVLARLLPDGYRDDPVAAGEFRQYTEPDLRAAKVAAARTVLGVTEDYPDELPGADPADPRSAYLGVYYWLGYLQDSLVRALS